MKLTEHAKERMKDRSVTARDIRNTLDNPAVVTPKRSDNSQEFRRTTRGKVHYVVVEHKKNVVIIITTGWSK